MYLPFLTAKRQKKIVKCAHKLNMTLYMTVNHSPENAFQIIILKNQIDG
jgi:hypothetical protein